MKTDSRKYDFEQSVARVISDHALLASGSRVIVALSGGADSVALLQVLVALGYDCLAAHCNFRLRGDESTRDMQHAAAVADRVGVDFTVRKFDAADYAREHRISVEMACRELRYAWFYELLEREHAAAIAVGHHREDQAETFMLNVLRGTGITGLAAMDYGARLIVRPLLDMSRGDIEGYLAACGLDYVTDSSNASNDYLRNRLRNRVLPALSADFPRAVDSILTTVGNVRGSLALYDYAAKTLIRPYVSAQRTEIDLRGLLDNYPRQVALMLLYEHLRPLGFNMTQVAGMTDSANSAQYTAGEVRALIDRGRILLRSAHADNRHPGATNVKLTMPVTEPVRIDITVHDVSTFRPQRDPDTLYLDTRVLDADADGREPVFELRPWRRGDRMQPFGMQHSKLLSDIFADARLDADSKRDVLLLTRNGTILWAVGLRASAHFAVTPDTRRYLCLHYVR